MEMQQIRYFLVLAQTLNFTRAAEACHVTQPALTRAIRALEMELGGDLIRREPRHSHLTELGRRMLPLLQQCHDAALAARSLAHAVHSNTLAPLPLAIMRGIAMAPLMTPLSALFRAFPGTQLRIRRGSAAGVLAMLKEGEVELAVSAPLGQDWDRLDAWPLSTDTVGLVVHRDHRLARRNEASIADLAGEPFLCLEECDIQPALEPRLAEAGIAAGSAHMAESDDDVLALLAGNAGVALLPTNLILPADLRRVAIPGLALERRVVVHAVAGRQRAPVAAALLNLLRSADWPEHDDA